MITACGGSATLVPVAQPATTPPSANTTAARPTTAAPPATTAAPVRCTASDLGLRLGDRGPEPSPGQRTVALVYTNISNRPCYVSGVPGVDLMGPADPNGPTYSVARPNADAAQPRYTLGPGRKATATLTYLTDTPGSVGSQGSKGWIPTQIITTPPGDTHQLLTPWTLGDTVVRQDAATHPGTFVGPLTAS